MFRRDRIVDPENTMGNTPSIRKSQVDKLKGDNARLISTYDMRTATKAQRANAAAKLQQTIKESTPEEIKEFSKHTGFTQRNV